MRRAADYLRLARRQRKIAATLPLSVFRQRFLTSAERYEALARASSELVRSERELE